MFSSATPSARTSMASTVTPRPSKTTALRSTPRTVMWSLSFVTETPTAEELAQLEELGPQWYAEAGLESGAEAATTVGTDAAVAGGVLATEEGALSIPVIGVAIAGGIAVGAAVGEGLWQIDKAIS